MSGRRWCWKEVGGSKRYLERTRWLIGYGQWGGEEGHQPGVWLGHLDQEWSPQKMGNSREGHWEERRKRCFKFCLGYIHFEFLLVKKLSRQLGIRVCSSGERSKLKVETNLIYRWRLDTREWVRTHRPVFLKLQILTPISELWNQCSGTRPTLKTKKR